MDNSKKIILDLCGGTGSWSKPYKEAGYDVKLITLPEHDVLTYEPPIGGGRRYMESWQPRHAHTFQLRVTAYGM